MNQEIALFELLRQGHAPNLFQQVSVAFSQEEYLVLAEVAQFLGGFSPADATLVIAKSVESAFQVQIIRGKPRDVIAVQQIFTKALPAVEDALIKSR